MKITRIEAVNVLGLARAEIDISTPILLVAGNNEAGKSTLADAISMALLGQPRRVKLKKELDQLLHDGSQKGRVLLLDGDGETLGMIRLPRGEHTQPPEFQGKEFAPYLVSPDLFASLPEAERRTLLFALTKSKANPEKVEAELIARGVQPAIAAEIKPLLRGGFAPTAKMCAERATQAKGAWRQITGLNWGAVQAESWAPEPVRSVSEREIHTAQAALISAQALQDQADQAFMSADQAQKEAAGTQLKIDRLNDLAGNLQRATAKLDATRIDLADWSAKQARLEIDVRELQQGKKSMACPCCQSLLVLEGDSLQPFSGAESNPEALAEARAELSKAINAVSLYARTEANDLKAIDSAQAATTEVGILQAQLNDKPSASAWANAAQLRDERRTEVAAARQELEALLSLQRAQQNSAAMQQRARQEHDSVLAWLAAAEALSPAGIPAGILQGALTPVNDVLSILAGQAGWKKVEITPDIEITVGGRLYGLTSESAKWRADALISLAIAQISGAKFVVLDRFDVLDHVGRTQLLRLLKTLAQLGSMETMVMSGTLKAMPDASSLGPLITGVWIENAIAETSNL